MKNYIITLLVAVLCLCGCSSESDPQSVAFSMDEYRFDRNGGQLGVIITANCSWTISGGGNGLHVDRTFGDGDLPIIIDMMKNDNYEDKHYILTLTSEDGTSTSILNIYQDMALGLKVEDMKDMIRAEGGKFSIPVSTNESDIQVEVPDWITYTPSRGLSEYTYSFSAEPNKTGSPRSGTISMKGIGNYRSVTVKQDSYAPEYIDLSDIPDMIPVVFSYETMSTLPVSYSFGIQPEYADRTKLSVTSSHSGICYPEIFGDSIRFNFPGTSGGYGQYLTFIFYSDGKEIGRKKVEYVSGKVDLLSGEREFCPGQEFEIETTMPEKYYTVEVSDKSAISIISPNRFRAEKVGNYTVSFINKASGLSTDVSISIQESFMSSYMSYSYGWGTLWDVEITGEFRSYNIGKYTTCFVDGGSGAQIPLNKKEGLDPESDKVVNKYFFSIIAGDKEDLKSKISKFKFVFSGIVNGKEYSREVNTVTE